MTELCILLFMVKTSPVHSTFVDPFWIKMSKKSVITDSAQCYRIKHSLVVPQNMHKRFRKRINNLMKRKPKILKIYGESSLKVGKYIIFE